MRQAACTPPGFFHARPYQRAGMSESAGREVIQRFPKRDTTQQIFALDSTATSVALAGSMVLLNSARISAGLASTCSTRSFMHSPWRWRLARGLSPSSPVTASREAFFRGAVRCWRSGWPGCGRTGRLPGQTSPRRCRGTPPHRRCRRSHVRCPSRVLWCSPRRHSTSSRPGRSSRDGVAGAGKRGSWAGDRRCSARFRCRRPVAPGRR